MSDNTPQPAAAAPEPGKTPRPGRTVAVIDIGATSIRMKIAQIGEQGDITVLESLRRGVPLGKDTFTRGRIQQSTIRECVDVLKGFRQVMEEYGVTQPDQVQAIATSSVREAENRDTFLDRVYISTGISVRAIDEAEENRLTYTATQSVMEHEPLLKSGEALVVDVGGGSTELLLLQNGQVTYSNSYRLGSVRMRETLETHRAPTERVRTILGQHISRLVEQMARSVPVTKPALLVAMSGDARFAASQLCADWAGVPAARVDYKTLSALVEKLLPLTVDKLVTKYRISYQEAETIGPGLLVYLHLARAFKIDQLIIPKASIRDGLLKEMSLRGYWTPSFAEQVVHSAGALMRKYEVDEKHARHVADLCVRLFRELQPEHKLDARHELLLQVAALIHEVGGFISSRSHHKHSLYLILNSDLFGLTRHDTTLIALVARYHRRALPGPTHEEYMALDRDSRIAVSKMAAILRVADALDRNHVQQVGDLAFAREPDQFVISVRGIDDLTMERLAMKEKGNLFQEVYGIPVVLRESRATGGEGPDAG